MCDHGTCSQDDQRETFQIFAFSNSYRYIDVLPKFIKAYNDTVLTTNGMSPSLVTDADVLQIWCRMEAKTQRVRVAAAMYRVGQHVRISKEIMRFAKTTQHNFITEIFGIA